MSSSLRNVNFTNDAEEDSLRIASLLVKADSSSVSESYEFFSNVVEELDCIPEPLQHRLCNAFEKLPVSPEIPVDEVLKWAQLLVHCTSSSSLHQLRTFYATGLKELEGNKGSIPHLKVTLSIMQAILQCHSDCSHKQRKRRRKEVEVPRTDDGDIASTDEKEISEASFLKDLMQAKCLPAIMNFAKHGKSNEDDRMWMQMLLRLMFFYPEDLFEATVDSGKSWQAETPGCKEPSSLALLDLSHCFDPSNNWTAGTFVRTLLWIRSNFECMKDKAIRGSWNKAFGRVVIIRYPSVVSPHLCDILHTLHKKSSPRETLLSVVRLLDRLPHDSREWDHHFINSDFNDNHFDVSTPLILVHFLYCLHTSNDPDNLVTEDFNYGLSRYLKALTMEDSSISNLYSESSQRSFAVFKMSLVIISSNPSMDSDVFEDPFLSFVSQSSSPVNEMLGRIVVFRDTVFYKLITWGLFSTSELVELLDRWIEVDNVGFRRFFRSADLNTTLMKDQILEILAAGRPRTCKFFIQLRKTRLMQWTTEEEKDAVLNKIRLIQLQLIKQEETGDFCSKLKNYSYLINFTVLRDTAYFSDCSHMVEILKDCVSLYLLHWRDEELARVCLYLLANSLSRIGDYEDVAAILVSVDLQQLLYHLEDLLSYPLRYQGDKISFAKVSQIHDAYEIIYHFENVMLQLDFMLDDNKIEKIKWSMKTAAAHVSHTCLCDSVLKLVTFLVKERFEAQLLMLNETEPGKVESVLVTIQYLTQSLIHKAIWERTRILGWSFLKELLKFGDQDSGCSSILAKTNLEFDGWYLFMYKIFLRPKRKLSSFPLEFWQLILTWIKLITKKKEYLPVPDVDCPSYFCDYFTFAAELHEKIRSECTEHPAELPIEEANTWNYVFTRNEKQRPPPDPKKIQILQRIDTYCIELMDTTLDWSGSESRGEQDTTTHGRPKRFKHGKSVEAESECNKSQSPNLYNVTSPSAIHDTVVFSTSTTDGSETDFEMPADQSY